MSLAIIIRPATVSDLPAVSQLLGATWHATYDSIYGRERVADITARWHSPDQLLGGLANKNGAFLVALVDGVLAGTSSAVADDAGADLDLLRLYVRPAAQGKGVGAALLGETLKRFPRARAVRLEVEPANAGAIAFYQRHGFTAAGQTSDCGGGGDNIPALRMARSLGAD
jgi:ribosomal protein S18 acetylase RimI-like enzyme